MYDVTIIGAGASGVMCALALKNKNRNLKVLLLEKNDKLGKKLSITGNGHCNLGNINTDISNYNSLSSLSDFKEKLEIKNFDFLSFLDNSCSLKNYYDYLMHFGILITNEKGCLYPYSMQAISVCKSFERYLNYLNVDIKYNYDVFKVTKENECFMVNDEIISKKVVVATGGKSYPKTGSTGKGYNILKSFGHTITDLYPSLTQLKTNYKYIKDLQGVRTNAVVNLSVDGLIKSQEEGQVQFTKEALSGICIFNLSRNVGKYIKENKKVKIIIDLIPNYDQFGLVEYLKSFSSYSIVDALSCVINNKLSFVISKELGFVNKKMEDLTKVQLENVCFALKNMCFNITGTGDFETAQVTNGGASLDEFDCNLQSIKCKDLYAIGEVIDVDGKCGGYNLSWAFTSAIIVSDGILKK